MRVEGPCFRDTEVGQPGEKVVTSLEDPTAISKHTMINLLLLENILWQNEANIITLSISLHLIFSLREFVHFNKNHFSCNYFVSGASL